MRLDNIIPAQITPKRAQLLYWLFVYPASTRFHCGAVKDHAYGLSYSSADADSPWWSGWNGRYYFFVIAFIVSAKCIQNTSRFLTLGNQITKLLWYQKAKHVERKYIILNSYFSGLFAHINTAQPSEPLLYLHEHTAFNDNVLPNLLSHWFTFPIASVSNT